MNLLNKISVKFKILFITTCITVLPYTAAAANSPEQTPVQNGEKLINEAATTTNCLENLFDGPTGTLKAHSIDLDFTGRLTVGDLNADRQLDLVVSNRDQLAAYDLCGNKLWQVDANTNWDYPSHVFWNWTSYGYIGDADGDGDSEFLHIGSDWRTLYVRDGLSGTVEHEIDLGEDAIWMYVLLGNRSEEAAENSTRIFVTSRPGYNKVKAIDIRNGSPKTEWFFEAEKIQNAYMPPMVANLDQRGGDEIIHSTVAVDETGSQFWKHNFLNYSVLGAAHTLTVKDIDPDLPGLEAAYSIYGPKPGAPSLVSVAAHSPQASNWKAFSPHNERHSHQHSVGDFDVGLPGLEILARNNDAKNHWLIDSKGNVIHAKLRLNKSGFPEDWDSGELVQGIEWDDAPGTEVLYTERHVNFREIPRLVVASSTPPVVSKTPFFHGGIDTKRVDDDSKLSNKPDPSLNSWFGYVNRSQQYNNDGPYEGGAHAIDLFGDGREEILTWGARKVVIYYNSGDAGVAKRRDDPVYMKLKKLWCNVYNPR